MTKNWDKGNTGRLVIIEQPLQANIENQSKNRENNEEQQEVQTHLTHIAHQRMPLKYLEHFGSKGI